MIIYRFIQSGRKRNTQERLIGERNDDDHTISEDRLRIKIERIYIRLDKIRSGAQIETTDFDEI